MSEELTREAFLDIVGSMGSYGHADKEILRDHDAALRAQLAACQESHTLTQEGYTKLRSDYDSLHRQFTEQRDKLAALEKERDKANMSVAHYKGLALGTNPDAIAQRERADTLQARVRVLEAQVEAKEIDKKIHWTCDHDHMHQQFRDLQQQLATARAGLSRIMGAVLDAGGAATTPDDIENRVSEILKLGADLQTARANVVNDVIKTLKDEAESILQEWNNDPDCPKKTHESNECKAKCDAYCIMNMTVSRIAEKLGYQRALALKAQAQGTDTPTQGGPSE